MELKEEMVSQQTVYEGIIVNVRRDKARLLDGRIANREVVEHPGGVAVFAMDGQGRVALVRQFRYPLGEVTLELPAGKLEPGEDPRASGLRELAEETGLTPGTFLPLGSIASSPGILAERIHLFFARDLVQGEARSAGHGPPGRDSGWKDLGGDSQGVLPAGGAPNLRQGDSGVMEKKQKVLIVEDEKNIVDILRFNLRKEGYDTLEAFDGVTGLRLALEESPDLILLDLMLPEMNGFEVCKLLRDKGKNTPVLIITAREEEKDKILGLDLGADDYITKPFSVRELMARVKAHIRRVALIRQSAGNQEDRLDFGRLVIHKESAQATKDGERLELTQREFELLTYLASHAGRVFSRQELMERVWNYEGYVGDVRGVDVAVRRLREKLEDDPAQPKYIITRRGAGYYFQKDL